MRLAERNIQYVLELTDNGITTGWYVKMVCGRIADDREYAPDKLPATVQRWVDTHVKESYIADHGYEEFIYILEKTA